MSVSKGANVTGRKFTLDVPLDASGIQDFKPDREVKAAVQDARGDIQAQLVEFDEKGKGVARFSFAEKPGNLSLAVGPPDAMDEELFGLQTVRARVSARLWKDKQLVFSPIIIPPFYWHWWWRWCRDFTVRGRVLCPDGSPVAGAKVCAFDVDAWWWWSSKQLVGCDVTDATGSFEIKFRWCCGWWPWWWWRLRHWHLDPYLIERIRPVLEREPELGPIPLPDPVPDLRIFEDMLGPQGFGELNLTRHAMTKRSLSRVQERSKGDVTMLKADAARPQVDVKALSTITANPAVVALAPVVGLHAGYHLPCDAGLPGSRYGDR